QGRSAQTGTAGRAPVFPASGVLVGIPNRRGLSLMAGRRNLRSTLVGIFVLGLVACGGHGDGGDDDDGGDGGVTPTPPPSPAGSEEVSGAFFIGGVENAALGHTVWLLDHTGVTLTPLVLDDGGA